MKLRGITINYKLKHLPCKELGELVTTQIYPLTQEKYKHQLLHFTHTESWSHAKWACNLVCDIKISKFTIFGLHLIPPA